MATKTFNSPVTRTVLGHVKDGAFVPAETVETNDAMLVGVIMSLSAEDFRKHATVTGKADEDVVSSMLSEEKRKGRAKKSDGLAELGIKSA